MLIQLSTTGLHSHLRASSARAGFANEAQMLLLSQSSLLDLQRRLSAPQLERRGEDQVSVVSAERFRPNLLVGGSLQPHEEDTWQEVALGEARLTSAGLASVSRFNLQTHFWLLQAKGMAKPARIAAFCSTKLKEVFQVDQT